MRRNVFLIKGAHSAYLLGRSNRRGREEIQCEATVHCMHGASPLPISHTFNLS